MHCHDVLGIQENATRDEINLAFSIKLSKLESCKDVLGLAPYSLKIRELEDAQKGCIAWSERPAISRYKDRIAQTLNSVSSDVRLNEFCCGPCTFTDICCGVCVSGCDCLCPEVEISCCYTVCGSQAIPIISDLIIYAYWAFSLFTKWKKKQEVEEREYRIRQAERARSENAHLEEQLNKCRSEQKRLLEKLHGEEDLNIIVTAHMKMFSAIGTASLQPISDNQEKRIRARQDELDKNRKRERELQGEIASNQRIIDAGH